MLLKPSKSAARRTFLALSCIAPAFAPVAHAQQADSTERSLGGVTVSDTAITDEPGRKLESPKRTRTVLDTPQTITVISGAVIEQQNLLTLRDVLSTVPGITFGAGEGGTGPGDNITFRGYSASNDITIDGVRDSAQITRTDSFNLEQVEVTNGANSVISGAGSTGGNINIVTKRPKADDAMLATAGIGTDNYYRATVDLNKRVNDLVAVRLNAMWHRNDVPGRDVEDYKRWGVAPSVTIGIDSPTQLTLQYTHQEDDNIPQYGVPYYGGTVPGVHRSDYFGYRNVDKQRINVDQLTAIFEHEFSDTVSIRNLARWQDSRQLTQVNPPQGTYCLANNRTPTGGACTVNLGTATAPNMQPVPAGYYYATGPRGTTRDTRNQLMFDQIDLKAVFNTGAIEHTIDLGGSATWEKYDLYNGNVLRNADGSVGFTRLPLINIDNPNEVVTGPASGFFTYGSNVYTGAVNFIRSGHTVGEQTNVAGYLFDTMKLGKFELSAGGRIERNVGTSRGDTICSTVGGCTVNGARVPLGDVSVVGIKTRNADTLFSYRVGLNYKPVEEVSIYAAYGNSRTPSKNSVNGSCTNLGENGATSSTCNVNPESAKNYEVGVKGELFDGGLLLTAAAFRNERDKYAVISGDSVVPNQQLDGKSRVDGIALGASGTITSAWTITANYTYLKAKLLQSVSDRCLANPGSGTCTNTPANPNPGADQYLPQTPKHSGSLFTTYRLPFGLTVGYGFTYQGSFLLSAATPTAAAVKSQDFLIHQGYLAYDFSPNFSAQLNVKNIGDKLYYTRIRNNGWATPGDARSAVLTLTAKM